MMGRLIWSYTVSVWHINKQGISIILLYYSNCGLIFCHACCKETVPLPHQMIHTQERVCQACYNKVTMLLTKSVIEMENGIGEHSSYTAALN